MISVPKDRLTSVIKLDDNLIKKYKVILDRSEVLTHPKSVLIFGEIHIWIT